MDKTYFDTNVVLELGQEKTEMGPKIGFSSFVFLEEIVLQSIWWYSVVDLMSIPLTISIVGPISRCTGYLENGYSGLIGNFVL